MHNEKIISLTDNARQHLHKMILNESAAGFRLSVKKTGCSGYAYVTDLVVHSNADDCCIHDENVAIFIDQQAVPYLKGTVIDYIDQGLGQAKLVFHNPNAANLCGCGESFNLSAEQD